MIRRLIDRLWRLLCRESDPLNWKIIGHVNGQPVARVEGADVEAVSAVHTERDFTKRSVAWMMSLSPQQ